MKTWWKPRETSIFKTKATREAFDTFRIHQKKCMFKNTSFGEKQVFWWWKLLEKLGCWKPSSCKIWPNERIKDIKKKYIKIILILNIPSPFTINRVIPTKFTFPSVFLCFIPLSLVLAGLQTPSQPQEQHLKAAKICNSYKLCCDSRHSRALKMSIWMHLDKIRFKYYSEMVPTNGWFLHRL